VVYVNVRPGRLESCGDLLHPGTRGNMKRADLVYDRYRLGWVGH
jgi:hypothetical protein